MLRVTDQIVNPRQPPLAEACLELQYDLSPSTQGMIFIIAVCPITTTINYDRC